jgi:hypothetical protein
MSVQGPAYQYDCVQHLMYGSLPCTGLSAAGNSCSSRLLQLRYVPSGGEGRLAGVSSSSVSCMLCEAPL